MRPAVLVSACLGVLAACESNTNVEPVTVQWMDWPAEVNAGQSFRTRLVVWGVCADNPRFHPGIRVDPSSVSFAPYFVVGNDRVACVAEFSAVAPVAVLPLDTAGIAPGLSAPVDRSYEMRGTTWAVDPPIHGGGLPLRAFGTIVVRISGADQSLRNAAGWVTRETDIEGCSRVRPGGVYDPAAALVLEDQADTAGLRSAFVHGYIHDLGRQLCGETRVFHLVSRE